METTSVFAGLRAFSIVAVLAAGMAFVTAVPAVAEGEPSITAPACGIEQPGSEEPWAAPPERGRPGEPY
jgi:hypothetical protein